MKRALLCVAGDLHVNSTVSLGPPGPYQLDDGGTYRPSKVQRWINERWAAFWKHAEAVKASEGVEVVTILTGELADINKHPSAQYVSVNSADVVGMALEVLQPVRAVSDRIYVTRCMAALTSLSAVSSGMWRLPAMTRRISMGSYLRVCTLRGTPHAASRPRR